MRRTIQGARVPTACRRRRQTGIVVVRSGRATQECPVARLLSNRASRGLGCEVRWFAALASHGRLHQLGRANVIIDGHLEASPSRRRVVKFSVSNALHRASISAATLCPSFGVIAPPATGPSSCAERRNHPFGVTSSGGLGTARCGVSIQAIHIPIQLSFLSRHLALKLAETPVGVYHLHGL